MLVGSFGEVIFEVSNFKFLTFKDFRRKSSANFAEHKVINNPAVLEFLGRDLEKISLSIKLIENLGVNPNEEAQNLRQLLFNGEPNFLIINSQTVGDNPFVITDLSEKISFTNAEGKTLAAELDLTFKEYVE